MEPCPPIHFIFEGFDVIGYMDVDTGQWVLYVPDLGVSSYGLTLDKAEEMLRFVLGIR